jgi:hypothetical protein
MFPRIIWLARLLSLSVALLASSAWAQPKDLLLGKRPVHEQSVRRAGLLSDGVRAPEGDAWDTDVTCIFSSARSFVTYDLGARVPIAGAYLQGDNNDFYTLWGSDDGKSFSELWVAMPDNRPGQRGRFTNSLQGNARYLKVTARGGDGAYSLSEVQVFSTPPASEPESLGVRVGMPQGARIRTLFLYFGAAILGFLAFAYRGAKTWVWVLASFAPLLVGYLLVLACAESWPLEAQEVSMLRALTAALAIFALLRERIFVTRFPARRSAVLSVLLLSAVVAFASFYNLGRSQYWNAAEQRPEFVHTYDMRVYHPFAKYFRELGYDGVYWASVAAYAEDAPHSSLDQLANVEVRSLVTHRLQRVSEVQTEISNVKARFSPERWQKFKRDMSYFRDTMGPEYLRSLTDHGANATPLWVLFASTIFAWSPATPGLLTFGGLVDAILILGLFVAIWRVFGTRAALVAMVLFGANDLYMFGTNWAGATLRHDWLALLGFGVCALGAKRFALAGVCFALSVMIRAFPAIALLGVALPALAWAAERWSSERRLPSLKELATNYPANVRVLVAAAATGVVCLLVTSLLYSPAAWLDWWHKVSMLNSDIGSNDVSLRGLIAGNDSGAGRLMQLRKPLYGACIVACLGLVAWASRKREPVEAALLALPLIPVLMNPSNYYNHFIFLLPLIGAVGDRKHLFATALPFLALCVAQYWSTLDPDAVRHFELSTALLFAAFAWYFHTLLNLPVPVPVNVPLPETSPPSEPTPSDAATKRAE